MVTVGALAAGASGAAPKADKHDRAAIRQLLARQLTVPTKADSALLRIAAACPVWLANPAKRGRFVDSLRLPAEYRFLDASESRYASYRDAVARVRPHAFAFRDWLRMERIRAEILLRFSRALDSSRFDVCAYLNEISLSEDYEGAFPLLFAVRDDWAAAEAYWREGIALHAKRVSADRRFAALLRASGFTSTQIAALTGWERPG